MADQGDFADRRDEAAGERSGCNLCGSLDYTVLFRQNEAQKHQIVTCDRCGLMYAYPVGKKNIEKYERKRDDEEKYTWDTPRVRHAQIKARDYEDIASRLRSLLPEGGRVLEVGSSTGIFLDFMRGQGWDVVGVEPNVSAVEFTKKTFGLDFHQTTLDAAPLEEGSVAAAVMLHVIEHLDDPASVIDDVHRVLAPGGVFVVETPTYDSLAFRLLGRRERSISCNGHIFFFTEETLGDLLARHGFRVLEARKVGRTLSVSRLMWNLGVMSKSRRVKGLLNGITQRLDLEETLLHVNARDMIRIYARKE